MKMQNSAHHWFKPRRIVEREFLPPKELQTKFGGSETGNVCFPLFKFNRYVVRGR